MHQDVSMTEVPSSGTDGIAETTDEDAAPSGVDTTGSSISHNPTSDAPVDSAPVTPTSAVTDRPATAEAAGGPPPPPPPEDRSGGAPTDPAGTEDAIAGTSTLRGLLLYGAVLAFAALYIDCIVQILSKSTPGPAALNGAVVDTAAALAGILGSAFALSMGVSSTSVNPALKQHIDREAKRAARTGTAPRLTFTLFLHKAFSVQPGGTKEKSWPLTFGVWAYAIVGSAVAITYIFNQDHTPGTLRAIAVTFAGYVLALIHSAFGSGSSS